MASKDEWIVLSIDPGPRNFGLGLVKYNPNSQVISYVDSDTFDLTNEIVPITKKKMGKKYHNLLINLAIQAVYEFLWKNELAYNDCDMVLIEKTSFYKGIVFGLLGTFLVIAKHTQVHLIDATKVGQWAGLCGKGKPKKDATPNFVIPKIKFSEDSEDWSPMDAYPATNHEWDTLLNACYFLKNPKLFKCPTFASYSPRSQRLSLVPMPELPSPTSDSPLTKVRG